MKLLVILVFLYVVDAQAFLCTYYVGKQGHFPLPGECVDITSENIKNPSSILSVLQNKLREPFNYKTHKAGGLVLSNNLKLNQIYLHFSYDVNFKATIEDTRLIKELKQHKFAHDKNDIYVPSTVYFSGTSPPKPAPSQP